MNRFNRSENRQKETLNAHNRGVQRTYRARYEDPRSPHEPNRQRPEHFGFYDRGQAGRGTSARRRRGEKACGT
jgi:hypothetical protein